MKKKWSPMKRPFFFEVNNINFGQLLWIQSELRFTNRRNVSQKKPPFIKDGFRITQQPLTSSK